MAVALATLARDFHTSVGTTQRVITGYLLALAADAFGTSFWWSFGVCALAILPAILTPAILLPGPLESSPSVLEEIEEAESTNLDEMAEIIPE